MSLKEKALRLLNTTILKAQSSQKTYKGTKALYLKKSGGELLSKKVFEMGLTERLLKNGKSWKLATEVSKSVRSDLDLNIKQLKKARKDIVFRRIGGRVIPFRAKKL